MDPAPAPQKPLDLTPFAGSLPDIRSAGIMLFDPIWARRNHLAHSCELLHVIQGRVELITPAGRWLARRGDTLLVAPETSHRDSFDLDGELEVFFCTFEWPAAEAFFALVSNDTLAGLTADDHAELGRIFDAFRTGLGYQSPAGRLVSRSWLLNALLLMVRAAAPSPPTTMPRQRELMLAARAYIDKHYARCISLDEIAEALGVSSYYLSHVFSAESDFSLFAYLTQVRMAKAKALLLAGGMNVAEVAAAVGYDDANYFSKVFRRHVGQPPSRFAAQVAARRRQ